MKDERIMHKRAVVTVFDRLLVLQLLVKRRKMRPQERKMAFFYYNNE
jgi:hypothetical protein